MALRLAPLVLALLIGGCHTMHHQYDGPHEITPGTKLTQPSRSIGSFQDSRKTFYLLFGLFAINNNSGPVAADEIAGDTVGRNFDGITELRMTERFTFLDVLVNAFVGIIFSMMTVEVEGQVHEFQPGGQG